MKIIEWPTVLDLGESWHEILKEELQLPYFVKLLNFLEKERSSGVSIYPPENLVFHAFKQTAFEDV